MHNATYAVQPWAQTFDLLGFNRERMASWWFSKTSSMQLIALLSLSVCLAGEAHRAYRLRDQASIEPRSSSRFGLQDKLHPDGALASILLTFSPASAFCSSSSGLFRASGSSRATLAAFRPVPADTRRQIDHRMPVMSVDEESPNDAEEDEEWDEDWVEDWTTYEWWEDEISCVEYLDEESGQLKLGVYTEASMINPKPHIRPLVCASAEEGLGSLLVDLGVPAVPLTAVKRHLDDDSVEIMQVQMGGGQGMGNPHGEEGENVYDLREAGVSEDVWIQVNENRFNDGTER